jgi:ABC-type glycerol-3-phosphate transport system substrate-binding protein
MQAAFGGRMIARWTGRGISLVVGGFLALALAGCGGGAPDAGGAPHTSHDDAGPPGAGEAGPVTRLNWMGHWQGEDLRETLVHEIGREFDFLHPEIDLNLQFPGNIFGRRSKPIAATEIARMVKEGRFDWDIIWLDDYIYQYVAEALDDDEWGKRHLVDFETVPGFAETQKEFIVRNPIYRNQTGGILVGPYIEGYVVALWYNRDVAQKIGLEIRNRGMTFEDLLGYVKAVYEYNQDAETPVAAFYEASDWTTLEMLFQALVKSEIADFHEAIEEKGSEKKRAAMLKGFRAFEQLGRYDPLIPSHNRNIWFNSRHYVLQDEALFYVNGTWMYSHWRGIDPAGLKKMMPVQLPVFNEVEHTLGGYIPTFAVMKDSPNRDAAVELMMSWCQPQVAERWVSYTKNPTGLRGHLNEPARLVTDPYEDFQYYITKRYRSQLHFSANAGYLLGKQNADLQQAIRIKLRRLLTGDTTAQRAYETILEATR